jgi:hypothetical protein
MMIKCDVILGAQVGTSEQTMTRTKYDSVC